LPPEAMKAIASRPCSIQAMMLRVEDAIAVRASRLRQSNNLLAR
jgi:hypothetical protein